MESEIILIILNEKEINYIIIKSQGNKIGFTEDYKMNDPLFIPYKKMYCRTADIKKSKR